MTTVTIAGQDLHVIDRGSGDPVVFLHAFPFNAAMWEYQYAALESTHRVIGIDLPGFGSSPAPADPRATTMESLGSLVAGVITALELEKPTIVAASMGGYLVFAMLRDHIELLGDLVLVATRAKSDDVDTWERRTAQQAALEEGDELDVLAKPMVDNLLSRSTLDRPEIVEYVHALMVHSLPGGWIGALEAMKNRPDAMGALRGLPRRTLVVAGELDRITPLAESTLIGRLVESGSVTIIKDSSHLPSLENPVAFNEALTAFLTAPTGGNDDADGPESDDAAVSDG